MPIIRPTLSEIKARIESELSANLPGYVTGLRKSVEGVFASALAGISHGLHGQIFFLSKQIFADTAEGEYLSRIAGIYGVDRIEGVKATGVIAIAASSNGVVIPTGTQFKTATGVVLVTTEDATTSSLTASPDVEALEKGVDGNIAANTGLSIITPIAGLTGAATVTSMSGGTDDETDEALLSRLLLRIQTPPRGGATADYVAWAREVSGVTRAWAFPRQFGIGTVGVTFVRDGDGSGNAIIPDSNEVSAVQQYILGKKPVTPTVSVFSPTAILVTMSISVTPNNASVRSAITAELSDLFAEASAPGETIYLSQIREAISVASGETNNSITAIALNGSSQSPIGNIVIPSTHIAILSTVTFSTL